MKNEDKLYEEYATSIYKFLFSKAHDHDIAEDLTQETFYQAIKSVHKFQGKSSVFTWLCSIANHVWFDYLKNAQKNALTVENAANQDALEEDVFLKKENTFTALKMLHELQDPYKEVVYLRLFGDLSFKEIGSIYDKSDTWARVIYFRAIQKIKGEWDND